MLRSLVPACLLLAAMTSTRRVDAQPVQSVALRWHSSSPACIDQEALARSVEEAIGRSVLHSSTAAAATVEGSVGDAPDGGYRARIMLRGPTGALLKERELETRGEPCGRLDESIAVVIALMIDELRQSPAPIKVARVPPRATEPLGVALCASGGLSKGLLPDVTAFGALRGQVEHPAIWPIAMTLRGWGPSEKIENGTGARFSAWSADLGLCPTMLKSAGWKLGACAGAGTAVVSASPVGLVGGGDSTKVVAFGAASGHGLVRVYGPLWLRVDLSAMIAFRRLHYWYTEQDRSERTVHDGSVGAPMISFGIEVHSGS